MVKHDILVRGVDLNGNEQKPPVVLQMHDDDFPARFLRDLASPGKPPISTTTVLDRPPHWISQPLYQPVQRMLNVALADLRCNSVGFPRVDPKRIISAGLVIRRLVRQPGVNGGEVWDDESTLSAWMRNPKGQFGWIKLSKDAEQMDPDPAKQPQLSSGQAELDRQLTTQYLSTANTESTTPAFAAPPATCEALNRTVFYAVIPTASSEVSDTLPMQPPNINRSDLISSLPPLLRSSNRPPSTPMPPPTVDSRWMSDDFLNAVYPPIVPKEGTPKGSPPLPAPNPSATQFQGFTTALRMLHSVFGAFDGSKEGNAILTVLNRRIVSFDDGKTQPMGMGDFYQWAKTTLLDQNSYPSSSPQKTPLPSVLMPAKWEALSKDDERALVDALMKANTARSAALNLFSPQGRFQDSTRHYMLRMFFRIKGETPTCPPELVWSQYSKPFKIAPWHATGDRPHPPIPLPDPTSDFLKSAKPNCSFQVPGSLMNAMQGTSMSGLMSGAGGGGGLKLGWICGFNVPLISICAFFVLNIFLGLLNIVFFWMAIIKICIPFPAPSSSSPDGGSP